MRVKTQKNYFQTCGYTVAAGSKAHKVLQVPMAIGPTKIIKSIKALPPWASCYRAYTPILFHFMITNIKLYVF